MIIKEIIEDLIMHNLDIKKVLVTGSVPRNEASILQINGKDYLLSDIDLIIITERKNKNTKLIKNRIEVIEKAAQKKYHLSPFFEISSSILNENNLKRLSKNIRHYELYSSGEVVYTTYKEQKINNVNYNSIDTVMLNRLLIERLVKQYEFQISTDNILYKKIFAFRNILEIGTILCFTFNQFVSGYEARNNAVLLLEDKLREYITDDEFTDLITWMSLSLKIKLTPTIEKIDIYTYREIIEALIKLYNLTYRILKKVYKGTNVFKYSIIESMTYLSFKDWIKLISKKILFKDNENNLENYFLIIQVCLINDDRCHEIIKKYKELKI